MSNHSAKWLMIPLLKGVCYVNQLLRVPCLLVFISAIILFDLRCTKEFIECRPRIIIGLEADNARWSDDIVGAVGNIDSLEFGCQLAKSL